MEYFVISAKFVPLKYYTLSSQLQRLTSFSVGCSGRRILSPGQIAVMRKWSIHVYFYMWLETIRFFFLCLYFMWHKITRFLFLCPVKDFDRVLYSSCICFFLLSSSSTSQTYISFDMPWPMTYWSKQYFDCFEP